MIWIGLSRFFRIMRLGLDWPSNDMRVFGAFSYCSLDIVDTYFNIWIEFAQGVSQISFILKIHAAMQFLFLAKVFPIHVSQKLWSSQQGWNLLLYLIGCLNLPRFAQLCNCKWVFQGLCHLLNTLIGGAVDYSQSLQVPDMSPLKTPMRNG